MYFIFTYMCTYSPVSSSVGWSTCNILGNPVDTEYFLISMRFEVLTAIKIRIRVFWVMTLCSLVNGCQQSRGNIQYLAEILVPT
jgi:hypothetical protein